MSLSLFLTEHMGILFRFDGIRALICIAMIPLDIKEIYSYHRDAASSSLFFKIKERRDDLSNFLKLSAAKMR